MKKTILFSAMTLALSTSFQVHAIGEEVIKTGIKEAAGVAKAAINKNKSEVNVKNSKLDSKVTMNKSVSVGNTGISVKADKVNIKNSTIKNKVVLNKSINVGNAGVQLGK